MTRVALAKVPKRKGLYRVAEVEWKNLRESTEPEFFSGRSIAADSDYGLDGPSDLTPSFPPEAPEALIGIGESAGQIKTDFAAVILAVPPTVLSTLVRQRPLISGKARIVDAVPDLAELHRVGSAPIPVLHLYLEKKLEDIPPDPVALNGSKLSLAFTDISQNWVRLGGTKGTVLALSCSEPLPLVGPRLVGRRLRDDLRIERIPAFQGRQEMGRRGGCRLGQDDL